MARIVGVDLPKNKRGEIGLTYIYGIGNSRSAEILAAAQKSAESGTTADIVEKSGEEGTPNRTTTEKNLSDVLSGLETGAKTGTIQLNKGGLMKAPKPKKKTRKYNKGGLAGKK